MPSKNQKTISVSARAYARFGVAAAARGVSICELVEVALAGDPRLPPNYKQRMHVGKRIPISEELRRRVINLSRKTDCFTWQIADEAVNAALDAAGAPR